MCKNSSSTVALTFFVIIPPDLVPLIRADNRLMRRALGWRIAVSWLAGATCLCRSLQSFEAEVLHASLLLVVSHVESIVSASGLGLKLELCRLGYCHLVIGQSCCSGVANAGGVAAAVVTRHVELLKVVVGTGIVLSKMKGGILVGQIGISHVGPSAAHALVARVTLTFV